jgi:hypothetical protein
LVDFRYHALSLVAVFLALGIGIVLGVTVGDSLVSDADRNLRDSLRGDLTDARDQVRDEQTLGSKRDEVIEESAPLVAAARLTGRTVAVIAFDELPGALLDSVKQGVEDGGGRVARTAVISGDDRAELVRVAGRPRRLGRLIERGGPAARRLHRELPRRFSGTFRAPVDALVVYRDPPAEADSDDEVRALSRRERVEDAVLDGLRDNVVGVESLDTDPSQVGWFQDRAVPSVDNVDSAAGRLALVLLLEDPGDEGSYGYKDTADRAVPELQESGAAASP